MSDFMLGLRLMVFGLLGTFSTLAIVFLAMKLLVRLTAKGPEDKE